jgi:cbb3-type cytochrome c oxidase subunit III
MQKAFIISHLKNAKKWRSISLRTALLFFLGFHLSCVSEPAEKLSDDHFLMGSGYGIHSSVLLVKDLESTQKYFSEVLGFNISKRNQSEKGVIEGTISTVINLPDMSSLELLSVEDSARTNSESSFIQTFMEQHEGVRMYKLSSSSVDSTYAWLTAQGFPVDSVRNFRDTTKTPKGWGGDDGGPQILSVGFESRNPPANLPEFVEIAVFPYERMTEWNSFYNMQRSFVRHPNGVVGTAALKIAVEDLEAAREEYKKMGFTELEFNPSEQLARFKIKRNQELQLVAPQSPDDAIASFLMDRGSGIFALSLEVENLNDTYCFLRENLPAEAFLIDSLPEHLTVLEEYAQGVQLEFVEEPEEQRIMAQKLKMGRQLDLAAQQNAEGLYLKYCALCHGENREGYAADFAPSLRSHSLMATTKTNNFLRYTIQYGREGTAMAGYYDQQGGPLELIEIELLLQWLYEKSGVEEPIELSREPVIGDLELGAEVYAKNCSTCHGQKGEGVTAPALGHPMLLATATDEFLRYAIKEGRDSTLMPSFKDSLSETEIDAVTAFLRSRASGWEVPKTDTVTIPTPENYVLNPDRPSPDFNLREDQYVSAEQLNKALQDSMRIILLDARSKVAWRQTHIPGAIPVPYYEEPEAFIEDIPNDDTWIVAYCACPHAASGRVINTLKGYGYKNTAILDEGILVWAQLGYPVRHGQ